MPGPTSSSSIPSGQSLPSGAQLQEFVIERVLGSGGFGITYLAMDSRLGRQVVIKENLPAQFCWRDTSSLTVQPRHSSGEDLDNFRYSLESFEKEAATLASLDHSGIVKVLRSFEANGTAYFVMPFVEGVTFDEVLREREAQQRPFTEAELVALLDKVLAALGYLHERGIYHRDIKPGNLLITASGDPVLIDFGAARQRLSERSLTVIESPGYTPFEQMQSRGKVGPWSDLYALGGTLYKAITGETPPKAADRIMEDEVMPLAQRTELVSRYSQRFLGSIDRAMRPKLSERPQSAEEWVKGLRRQSVQPTPKPRADAVPSFSPKEVDPKGPSHADINPDWDAHSAAPKAIEAGEENSTMPSGQLDTGSLLLGTIAIGLLWLIILVSFLNPNYTSKNNTIEFSKSVSVSAPTPAPEASAGATTSKTAINANPVAAASKDLPFINGLGMKFVPAGTLGVLFSVWETRVRDFEAFVEETGHDAISENSFGTKAYTLEENADGGVGWDQNGGSWRAPRFPTQQTGEHPVVCVSYLDAEAFCAWLTKKERASGKIPATASYRLPTDSEWSRAVGETEFPWGDHWPPNSGDGNYAGQEAIVGVLQGYRGDLVEAAFKDSAARTAPVGMFAENRFGLHDMGGNVVEWCSTWYTADLNDAETKKAVPALADDIGGQTYRVLRGASWFSDDRVRLRSSYRDRGRPVFRDDGRGFRVVLVAASG